MKIKDLILILEKVPQHYDVVLSKDLEWTNFNFASSEYEIWTHFNDSLIDVDFDFWTEIKIDSFNEYLYNCIVIFPKLD